MKKEGITIDEFNNLCLQDVATLTDVEKATNGQIIPEFKCSSLIKIDDGAQLIEIGKDGTETVIAIFDVDFGRFISVDK